MPAPIAVDKEQVRMLVLNVGVREAARQCGINEKTVLHWSHTNKWLADTRPSPAKLPPPASQIGSVVSVAPADALGNILAQQSKTTRLNLARAVERASEQARDHDDPLGAARNIKETAATASMLHNWDAGSAKVNVNIYSDGMKAADVIEIESEVTDIGHSEPLNPENQE